MGTSARHRIFGFNVHRLGIMQATLLMLSEAVAGVRHQNVAAPSSWKSEGSSHGDAIKPQALYSPSLHSKI
jgi:hypothetical protein